MSDTTKDVEKLDEVNVAAKDGAPAEATHLKNDAVDMGAPVVKPTDKNPDAASKAKQNTSDPAKKSAKDGSLENDQKSSSMKEVILLKIELPMNRFSIESIIFYLKNVYLLVT